MPVLGSLLHYLKGMWTLLCQLANFLASASTVSLRQVLTPGGLMKVRSFIEQAKIFCNGVAGFRVKGLGYALVTGLRQALGLWGLRVWCFRVSCALGFSEFELWIRFGVGLEFSVH